MLIIRIKKNKVQIIPEYTLQQLVQRHRNWYFIDHNFYITVIVNFLFKKTIVVRFQVLTVASMKMAVFWVVAPSGRSLLTFQRCLLPSLP
jgi:hypothetical protein